ncbi:hypothetical protein ACFW5I_34210 [Streptomyces sp. NPDC058818]|uniref:hypothetical protein n=1 Tax=Streptomyces sp. NPDC058818 TaxID=3346640 RepID=UPI0036CCDE6C
MASSLDLGKSRHDLGHAATRRVRARQRQARHLPLLGSEITNADEVQDSSASGLEGVMTK